MTAIAAIVIEEAQRPDTVWTNSRRPEWVLFISLINVWVQNLAPDWVRARVLAIFTLVYMGSFALGSAVWGGVAQHQSVRLALVCSGFGTVASAILGLLARLPNSTADLTPWNHWRMPVIVKEISDELLMARCWSRSNTSSLQSRRQSS